MSLVVSYIYIYISYLLEIDKTLYPVNYDTYCIMILVFHYILCFIRHIFLIYIISLYVVSNAPIYYKSYFRRSFIEKEI